MHLELIDYFKTALKEKELVFLRIETQFVTKNGNPISKKEAQLIMSYLANGIWTIQKVSKTNEILSITNRDKDIIQWKNIHTFEVVTSLYSYENVVNISHSILHQLYKVAETVGAKPVFSPILVTDYKYTNLLINQNSLFVQKNGPKALEELAKTASVKVYISVTDEKDGIRFINFLWKEVRNFLADFPQNRLWGKFIKNSKINYFPDRYGGPSTFHSLEDYCIKLLKHSTNDIYAENLETFLKSIWWHFQLVVHNDVLFVEINPLPRLRDTKLNEQLNKIIEIYIKSKQ